LTHPDVNSSTPKEWQFGYLRRFGIFHVDYDTLERTPKSSALFYRETIKAHGENIVTADCFEKTIERYMLKELRSAVTGHGYTPSHNINVVAHSQLAMVHLE